MLYKISTKSCLKVLPLLLGNVIGYTLQSDVLAQGPQSFFNAFDFFDQPDPTNGAQQYVAYDQANEARLIGYTDATSATYEDAKKIYIGLDSSTNPPKAVRISSKATFSPGTLLLADIDHMPAGCGTWPSMWLLGGPEEWPLNGEIDVIENVNSAKFNQMTLHTGPGCAISSNNSHTAYQGTLITSDCNVKDPNQPTNAGCGIAAPADSGPVTFGTDYNKAGGGIWAMEWTTTGISIWFMSRSQASDIMSSASPDPSTFGKPLACFDGSGCGFGTSFKNMSLIFNTALCGDWAGQDAIWASSGCAASTGKPTCQAFVADPGDGLSSAFWIIGGLKIFTS